jgi:hypothetical protein
MRMMKRNKKLNEAKLERSEGNDVLIISGDFIFSNKWKQLYIKFVIQFHLVL